MRGWIWLLASRWLWFLALASCAGEVDTGETVPDASTPDADAAACLPAACDDCDPCTLDEHPPGYCTHTPIPNCEGGTP